MPKLPNTVVTGLLEAFGRQIDDALLDNQRQREALVSLRRGVNTCLAAARRHTEALARLEWDELGPEDHERVIAVARELRDQRRAAQKTIVE